MKSLQFVASLAAIVAMQQPGLATVQLYLNSSRGYNQILHKHHKHRRGKPK